MLRIGARIGINYSNVYDTEGDEFRADAIFGFVAGGFIAVPLGTRLGFQPEVLYSQKGFKGSGSLLGNDYEFIRTSNFINVP